MTLQRHRIEYRFCDEAECALRANGKTAKNLHGRHAVKEGVEPVPIGVLDGVLRPDECDQVGVRLDFGLERDQPGTEFGIGSEQAESASGSAVSTTVPEGSTSVTDSRRE